MRVELVVVVEVDRVPVLEVVGTVEGRWHRQGYSIHRGRSLELTYSVGVSTSIRTSINSGLGYICVYIVHIYVYV